MPTCRLSAVITGCGGKEMTCSRRSIVARTRSTNGTRTDRPGDSVRLKRPRRSTTLAWACGTMVTLLPRMMITRTTITSAAIRAGVTAGPPSSSGRRSCPRERHSSAAVHNRVSLERLPDHRGGALHLDDPDDLPDGEALGAVLAARRPLVGAELNPAAL